MVHAKPRSRSGCWVFLSILVLVGMLVAPASTAIAQVPEPVPEPPPTFVLPEVIVPGKRPQPPSSTPASVSVVTREEIERSGARTAADALRMVPELSVRAYGGLGGLAQASIRGSTPSQVLVLLDGIPLNSVALGQTDLTTISVDAVERIEVLRGPFAAIYGSGALGGVINIVTAKEPQRQILGSRGGFNQRSASLALVGSRSTPWQLTISSDVTAGHRINSDYAGTTLVAQLGLSADTRLLLHHYAADLGTPGDISFPTPTDRQVERRTVVQIELGSAPLSEHRGRLYYTTDSLAAISAFPSTYYSTVLGGEWQRTSQVGSQRVLTGGIEVQRQALNAVVSGSPIVRDAVIGAGYLEYDAAISDRLLASLGMRVDSHSIYGGTINPRAGFVYHLNGVTRARAAIGRTFRGPSFLELYYPAPFGNPALLPETAWAAEIGLQRDAGNFKFEVVAFATDATNLIVGGAPPQNIGQASIRGLSGEVKGIIGLRTSIVGSITVQRAVNLATGSLLLRVPEVSANLALHYQDTPSSVLSVLAAYVGPRLDVDFSSGSGVTVQVPGYVDLRVRYQITTSTEWVVQLAVDNALDWQYEAVKGYPAPGRSAFMTLIKKF
jgi:outer membrane cobalamin receptor